MNRFRKVFRSEDGFTLIELLVVIAVLAILAALAVPRLGGLTDRARLSEATNSLSTIKSAMEMYYVEHNNSYPSDGVDLTDADQLGQYVDNFADIEVHWNITYENDADPTVTLTGNDTDGYDSTLVRTLTRSGNQWEID